MSLDSIIEKFQRVKDLLTVAAPQALDRIVEILDTAKNAVSDAASWLRGGAVVNPEKMVKSKKKKEEEPPQIEPAEEARIAVARLEPILNDFRIMGNRVKAAVIAMRGKKNPSDMTPSLELNTCKMMASVVETVMDKLKEGPAKENSQENEGS